jgi:hypothetical protein
MQLIMSAVKLHWLHMSCGCFISSYHANVESAALVSCLGTGCRWKYLELRVKGGEGEAAECFLIFLHNLCSPDIVKEVR